MKKYYLWCKQAYGCDYTIACGEMLREIEGALNMVEAQRGANDLLRDLGFGGSGDRMELEFASVLEVGDERKFDIHMLETGWALSDQMRRRETERVKDEAEFERLRQKLRR